MLFSPWCAVYVLVHNMSWSNHDDVDFSYFPSIHLTITEWFAISYRCVCSNCAHVQPSIWWSNITSTRRPRNNAKNHMNRKKIRTMLLYITWHLSLAALLSPSCDTPPLATSFFFDLAFLFFLPSNCSDTLRVFSIFNSSYCFPSMKGRRCWVELVLLTHFL